MRVKREYEDPPSGTFKGANFMTPSVLGYFRTSGGAWIELSRGRGFTQDRIYGITVRRSGGSRLDPDPSKVAFSLSEAHSYMASL